MTKPFRIRFFGSQSHNLKSKTCTEPLDSAQDKLRRSFLKRSRRRKWLGLSIIAFVLVVAGAVVQAQQAKKIPRIGYLSNIEPACDFPRSEVIRQALRELGYIEGQNIAIEYRYAEGRVDRLPELAAELVR